MVGLCLEREYPCTRRSSSASTLTRNRWTTRSSKATTNSSMQVSKKGRQRFTALYKSRAAKALPSCAVLCCAITTTLGSRSESDCVKTALSLSYNVIIGVNYYKTVFAALFIIPCSLSVNCVLYPIVCCVVNQFELFVTRITIERYRECVCNVWAHHWLTVGSLLALCRLGSGIERNLDAIGANERTMLCFDTLEDCMSRP